MITKSSFEWGWKGSLDPFPPLGTRLIYIPRYCKEELRWGGMEQSHENVSVVIFLDFKQITEKKE